MSNKNVYLLRNGNVYDLKETPGYYDEERNLNVIIIDGQNYPLVSVDMNIITESKTLAAPGDDDPDPEDEMCY